MQYSVKCSFLEIYNETITDLLRPSSGNLNLREDMKRGCYVDNLTEEIVLNGMHCGTAALSFTVAKWAASGKLCALMDSMNQARVDG